jgi:AraC-like DNA-binding protein
MLTSTYARFGDPYSYQARIRASDVELVVTGRGDFRAELVTIDLHRLWMQWGCESLPRIAHSAQSDNRRAIFFLAGRDEPAIHYSGRELTAGEIVVHGPEEVSCQRTSAACRWAAKSLPSEDLAAAARSLAGREIPALRDANIIRPAQGAFARLLRLHKAADSLAQKAPQSLAHPETARALENALVHVMIACLTEQAPAPDTFGSRCHATVMQRFERVLAEKPKQPLYLAEICAATGVSERTLRICCHEHLGMGPMRFLWLRRMHLARRALQMADPKTTSVTAVAGDHGFWELGRFSIAYRSLFGESPSATLRRACSVPPAPHDSPFALGPAVSA